MFIQIKCERYGHSGLLFFLLVHRYLHRMHRHGYVHRIHRAGIALHCLLTSNHLHATQNLVEGSSAGADPLLILQHQTSSYSSYISELQAQNQMAEQCPFDLSSPEFLIQPKCPTFYTEATTLLLPKIFTSHNHVISCP